MQEQWKDLRINPDRLLEDFEALSTIGKSGDTGVNRPALSQAHLEARAWLREKIIRAGLEFHQDGAGNHSAKLRCGPEGAPSLLMGSHLDSVPDGGRFDGALGVLTGLEVLRTVQEAAIRLPFNLELYDFTDEEGSLVSFLGSFAFAGLLAPEDLENPRGDPQALATGLARAGLSPQGIFAAHRDPRTLAGYLELHVEQGSELEKHGLPIGVVTQISGIAFYRLSFLGRADHAGSIATEERRDAALGASDFILALRNLLLEQFPECFANVGDAHFEPGAFNIVPKKVTLAVEFRAATLERFEQLKTAFLRLAKHSAERYQLGLEVEFIGKRDPVATDTRAQSAIQEAAEQLGLRTMPMISRAGHDAQAVATLCPIGMIFVPSVGGISHSPDEVTHWEDCVNGANVLLQAVFRLAFRL
jgi:N-carbamoyl-L-amino-acid hydrolase